MAYSETKRALESEYKIQASALKLRVASETANISDDAEPISVKEFIKLLFRGGSLLEYIRIIAKIILDIADEMTEDRKDASNS